MNIYIWNYTSPVSTEYHDGGGLLIVADSLEDARDQWSKYAADQDLSDEEAVLSDPDHVFPTSQDAEPQVMVFLDAGCCGDARPCTRSTAGVLCRLYSCRCRGCRPCRRAAHGTYSLV